MSQEYSACQLDDIRNRLREDRAVEASKAVCHHNHPQAPETHKQGCYQPPGPGKKRPHFPIPNQGAASRAGGSEPTTDVSGASLPSPSQLKES